MEERVRWYGGGIELPVYVCETERGIVEILVGYNEHTPMIVEELLTLEAQIIRRDKMGKPSRVLQNHKELLPQ